ncbi:MAG: hypothetical protein ACRC8C_01260 [Mycoplasmoidaceae bacterium]
MSMWWNIALGTSMLASSISGIVSSIANVAINAVGMSNSINNPDQSGNNSFKPSYLSNENIFLRLSKYPSKSYIGYGLF